MSTTGVVFVKEHAAKVKPPRMLWVPFGFGNALGRAEDPGLQHQVLGAALELLERPAGPVLEEFPDDTAPEILFHASAAPGGQDAGLNPADELTGLRHYYERWVAQHDGRTSVGLCGVPQRRFRGVIRFLEAYADGQDVDAEGRPEGAPLPQYIRFCVDDLKAFYYEARMEQRPDTDDAQLHEWFWSETALAKLVVRVAERMEASDDPLTQAIPYGLAR